MMVAKMEQLHFPDTERTLIADTHFTTDTRVIVPTQSGRAWVTLNNDVNALRLKNQKVRNLSAYRLLDDAVVYKGNHSAILWTVESGTVIGAYAKSYKKSS